MTAIRTAINGFGRMARIALRKLVVAAPVTELARWVAAGL